MACCICGEQIHILAGPEEQKWLCTNKGMVHLTCYISDKPGDMRPLTRLGAMYIRDKISNDKEKVIV